MTALRNLARTLWRHIVAPDPAGPHKSPLDVGFETSPYNRPRHGGKW